MNLILNSVFKFQYLITCYAHYLSPILRPMPKSKLRNFYPASQILIYNVSNQRKKILDLNFDIKIQKANALILNVILVKMIAIDSILK